MVSTDSGLEVRLEIDLLPIGATLEAVAIRIFESLSTVSVVKGPKGKFIPLVKKAHPILIHFNMKVSLAI